MPKGRHLKVETWTDDKFVTLSPLARLLFMGMWNYACDNGHVEDNAIQLKMRLLPMDSCDVRALLDEVLSTGQLIRGQGYLKVVKLVEHQRIDLRYLTLCEWCEHDVHSVFKASDKKGRPVSTRRAPEVSTAGAHPVHEDDGEGDGEGDGDGDGDGDDEGREPAIADPAPSTSLALVTDDRPDVDRICETLADYREDMGSRRPTVTAGWRKSARLMLDNDGRTETEVIACLRWLFASNHRDARFWRTNVRSMPKLREEYDRLRELATQAPAVGGRASEQSALLERAMARAEARERSGA